MAVAHQGGEARPLYTPRTWEPNPDSSGDEVEVIEYPEPRRSLSELGTVSLVPQSALYQPVRAVGLAPISQVVHLTLTVRVARLFHHLLLQLRLGLRPCQRLHLQWLRLELHPPRQGAQELSRLRTRVRQLLHQLQLRLTHIVSQARSGTRRFPILDFQRLQSLLVFILGISPRQSCTQV